MAGQNCPRPRRLPASSASLRVFGVSPRLRRLSASSASLRVFGVSPRLRRLSASSASLRVFGVPPRLRRPSASSASLRVFGVSARLRRLRPSELRRLRRLRSKFESRCGHHWLGEVTGVQVLLGPGAWEIRVPLRCSSIFKWPMQKQEPER